MEFFETLIRFFPLIVVAAGLIGTILTLLVIGPYTWQTRRRVHSVLAANGVRPSELQSVSSIDIGTMIATSLYSVSSFWPSESPEIEFLYGGRADSLIPAKLILGTRSLAVESYAVQYLQSWGFWPNLLFIPVLWLTGHGWSRKLLFHAEHSAIKDITAVDGTADVVIQLQDGSKQRANFVNAMVRDGWLKAWQASGYVCQPRRFGPISFSQCQFPLTINPESRTIYDDAGATVCRAPWQANRENFDFTFGASSFSVRESGKGKQSVLSAGATRQYEIRNGANLITGTYTKTTEFRNASLIAASAVLSAGQKTVTFTVETYETGPVIVTADGKPIFYGLRFIGTKPNVLAVIPTGERAENVEEEMLQVIVACSLLLMVPKSEV